MAVQGTGIRSLVYVFRGNIAFSSTSSSEHISLLLNLILNYNYLLFHQLFTVQLR